MVNARDLIKSKNETNTFSISPASSVQEAVKLMAIHNVGALLVEEVADKVLGIFTERDIVLKVNAPELDPIKTQVRVVMTEKVIFVEGHQSIEECMDLMITKGIRHLPVYEKGDLLGLISIRDVLRAVIAEQKTMISHLENYISGV